MGHVTCLASESTTMNTSLPLPAWWGDMADVVHAHFAGTRLQCSHGAPAGGLLLHGSPAGTGRETCLLPAVLAGVRKHSQLRGLVQNLDLLWGLQEVKPRAERRERLGQGCALEGQGLRLSA